MRRKALLVILLPLLVVGCHHRIRDGVIGSGSRKIETRDLPSFTGISTEGAFDIQVSCQKPQSIEVEGDDNILPLINTEVSDNVLHIRNLRSYSVQDNITIRITVPNLEGVSASGAGKLDISGLKNDKFEVTINGAPSLKLAGQTKLIDIDANGAGKIDAHKLLASRAVVDSKGVARIEVHAQEELNVTISGPSHVIYDGDPKVNKTVHGPGNVEKRASTGA